ncbi:MAG: response regulator transcription factor [Bacteroidota bacterium]
MNQIRILIVEDDIFIAQDIQDCLERMDYVIAGVAYQREDAIHFLREKTPDLALLDVNLGNNQDGILIGKQIHEEFDVPFIYLTSYANKAVLDAAKETHPMGYIVKPFNEKDLYSSIEIALFNFTRRWQPPQWKASFINQKLDTDFTAKEIEILKDIFEGKTNRQLSDQHNISLNTVKTHVKRIYDKLAVHSRSEAMAYLRRTLGE